MSAVPKRSDPAFWIERAGTDVRVLPKPDNWGPSAPESAWPLEESKRTETRRRVLTWRLNAGFERPLSYVLIATFLLGWSLLAYGALSARIEARDTRLSVQHLQGTIGILKTQVEEARGSLDVSDPSLAGWTLPIEPGDVACVPVPPVW